jgi:methionyl-tRNA formyltransferase
MPGMQVTGVVTAPETFRISYRPSGVRNVLHADVVGFARDHGIPFRQLKHGMGEEGLLDTVRGWQPEFMVAVGWYHLIPKRFLNLAPVGALHASLLPDYSGNAPLVWAIINGETRTGITFFLLDEGVDSGPMIAQAEEPILPDDTIATLYARIEDAGLGLLREWLPRVADGSASYTPQDHSKRRIMPARSPEDGEIDLKLPAKQLYNFIRAQSAPYPGAFLRTVDGKKLVIEKARLEDDVK